MWPLESKRCGNRNTYNYMEQKLKFISKEQLLELLENREDFILVEVLAKEQYDAGHLPLAINIPVDKLEVLAPTMLPDKQRIIVVYCSDFLCGASTGAVRLLQSLGYAHVLDYKGGKDDWAKAGLPLV